MDHATRQIRTRPHTEIGRALERVSHHVTVWSGSSWAFALAALVIVGWLVTGPLFHFSDTWQLVINTSNDDCHVPDGVPDPARAEQRRAGVAPETERDRGRHPGASNRLIDVEALSEKELNVLHEHYQRLATMAKGDIDIRSSHSVEEAETRHKRKRPVPP